MSYLGATELLNKEVIEKGLCTNCGACVNICPYYVSYNDKSIVMDRCLLREGACIEVCPALPTDREALKGYLFDIEDMTQEMGAVKRFYISRAANEKLRENAQHGGTVSALLSLALSEGIIDAAVVSGKDQFLSPGGLLIENEEHVLETTGSRFVVTPMVAKFNEVASKSNLSSIGIVATPCQALALAKMKMSKNERLRQNAKKITLIIGLFCGWAMSSKGLSELLSQKGIDTKEVYAMDIPPSKYGVLEVFTKKKIFQISLGEVQTIIRPSCQVCEDMTCEFSDISIGSARLPEGWEVARKWNHVIVRTQKGEELMELAKKRGMIELRDIPDDNIKKVKDASLNKKERAKNIKERKVEK